MDQLHRRALRDHALELVRVDAVGLEPDTDPLGAQALQQQQRAVIRGLLDDDAIAGPDEMLEEHRPGLERSVRDHHLPWISEAVALGDPLAEARMPDPGSV